MTTDPIKALEDAPTVALRAAEAVYRHACTSPDECCHHHDGFVYAIRAAVDAVTPTLAALHGPDDAQKLFMHSIDAQRNIGRLLSRTLTMYSGEDISWSSDEAARMAAKAIKNLCLERDERTAELDRLREEVAELCANRDKEAADAPPRTRHCAKS